jgi:hypothetical protein
LLEDNILGEAIDPTICIPNIGPKERQRRLRGGIVGLAVAAIVALALFATGADRGWRLIMFPLLYGGLAGVFQWREKT